MAPTAAPEPPHNSKDQALEIAANVFRSYEEEDICRGDMTQARKNREFALMCEYALKGVQVAPAPTAEGPREEQEQPRGELQVPSIEKKYYALGWNAALERAAQIMDDWSKSDIPTDQQIAYNTAAHTLRFMAKDLK